MKRSVRLLYLAVCLCAAALLALLPGKLRADRMRLAALETELAASQETWQAIAAEKEGVLDRIADVEIDLKEARATLEEATSRKAELQAKVDALRSEVDALKNAEAAQEQP